MKKADTTLDFKNDNAMIFSESTQLIVTKSGHCAIHLCQYSPILNNVTTGVKNITLLACETDQSKYDIALKLHWQLVHPSPGQLTKLINSAAEHQEKDEKLRTHIKNVSEDCKICQIHRKSPTRPVVGLKNV